MRNVRRNLALSASVWTMGLASPACAATATGISSTITAPVVNATLTISNIGDFNIYGNQPAVTTTTTGEIAQTGVATSGNATLGMVNAGIGWVLANSVYFAQSGTAAAGASVATGIAQFGTASGIATLTLDNSGMLIASASSVALGRNALDSAQVDFGIYQGATGATGANVALTNAGGAYLQSGAFASATAPIGVPGSGYASAVAHVGQAITQSALATTGPVTVTLANAGALDAYASAHAAGYLTSVAQGYLGKGLVQEATADSGAATAALANTGSIALTAITHVASYASSAAANSAYATLQGGISQGAYAYGGDAAAMLDNSGTILVEANASVTGTAGGAAYAQASSLIDTTASTTYGNAATIFANTGSTTLGALAEADARGGLAQAKLTSGLVVTAAASAGDAIAAIDNSGMLMISATATKTGDFGAASAFATKLIDDETTAVLGNATTTLTNSGTAGLGATADNFGSHGAQAYASLSHAIIAYGAATLGNASVAIVNTGTFDLAASGEVIGTAASSAIGGSTHDTAGAYIASGFRESVYATAGSAAATFDNSGRLTVRAVALVTGLKPGEGTFAAAYATNDSALLLRASGSAGSYSVALANSGTLAIYASVVDPDGGPNAGALVMNADGLVSNGVYEYAHPYVTAQGGLQSGGAATVSLANSGSLDIWTSLAATATYADAGLAYTRADGSYGLGGVSDAILQVAIAGSADAGATLDNQSGGTIVISASGLALSNATSFAPFGYSGVAVARDGVSGGIIQAAEALGGVATVGLTNAGDIYVAANGAAVSPVGTAVASAIVQGAIVQSALAVGGAPYAAHATLANSGLIDIRSMASANAYGLADATATLDQGVVQAVSAEGAATVSLTNTGTIVLAADATAAGGEYAQGYRDTTARAVVQDAILQEAAATGADASAVLTNTGTLSVITDSTITSAGQASAVSVGTQLIRTVASAIGGNATADVTNAGTMSLSGHAASSGELTRGSTTLTQALAAAAGASSGNATAMIANAGTLTISALATNAGRGSVAHALGADLIDIGALAVGGNATAGIGNTGTATLTATGTAGSPFFDDVSATLNHAVVAHAAASSGMASAAVSNSGTFNIAATADVVGNDQVDSVASVNGGILANAAAIGGAASAMLDNAGALGVRAAAQVTNGSIAGVVQAQAHATAASAIQLAATGSAGTYTALLVNSGTLTIAASATQYEPAGSGYVYRYAVPVDGLISNGIAETAHPYLTASGGVQTTGAASVGLDNSGSIWIGTTLADTEAAAQAGQSYTRGDSSVGVGGISNAILQGAIAGAAAATVALDNESAGVITVSASTVATSDAPATTYYYYYGNSGSASGLAEVNGGIVQYGVGAGGSATVDLANAGLIGLGAKSVAGAQYGSANASAIVHHGLAQSALAVGAAPVTALAALANSGTIVLTATALGVSARQDNAKAQLSAAIAQTAIAYGPAASAATAQLTNTGILALDAYGQGTAAQYAASFAGITAGISQSAHAQNGTASAIVGNAATLAFSATALGTSVSGNGVASITRALLQSAVADNGTAVAGLENDGSINVTAVTALSTAEYGNANATITNALTASVTANGTSDGTAALNNTGTLTVAANAGMTGSFSQYYAGGSSLSQVNGAVDLVAVGAAGSYGVSFTNSGAVTVSADATDVLLGPGAIGSAGANGAILAGIVESATPMVANGATYPTGGTARLVLGNSGTLTFDVVNTANGGSAAAGGTYYAAYAPGTINDAILQTGLTNGGTLTEAIDNAAGATLSISALGNAASATGPANANASVANAVVQQAGVLGGTAALVLTNEGTVSIATAANVAGSGNAVAIDGAGLLQSASAPTYAAIPASGTVTLGLGNSGTIDVASTATATGPGSHVVRAVLGSAVAQVARFSTGVADTTATLINSGTIATVATARNTGGLSGYNGASAAGGLIAAQTAINAQGAAAAMLDNSGVLSLAVDARTASGGQQSSAVATLTNSFYTPGGIGQNVGTNQSGGTATAQLTNSGTMTFAANAVASGTAYVVRATAGRNPYLNANGGEITQSVDALAGTASGTIENTGAIGFDIAAQASGNNGIDALSTFTLGISQLIGASGAGGSGTGLLGNAGTITGTVAATAIQSAAYAPNPYAQVSATLNAAVAQSLSGAGTATLANTGTVLLDVAGKAQATGYAYAAVASNTALLQQGTIYAGPVALTVGNTGTLQLTAEASATGSTGKGLVDAFLLNQNLSTSGYGTIATTAGTATVINTGTMTAAASGTFTGTMTGEGSAYAGAIVQQGEAAQLNESVANAAGGLIAATATLSVTAPKGEPTYHDQWPYGGVVAPPLDAASAVGIAQTVSAYSTSAISQAVLGVTNAGTIAVTATNSDLLSAIGGTAQAVADGLRQDVGPAGTAMLANSGTISVVATVTAAAGVATASAQANLAAMAGTALAGEVTNTGTLVATATVAGSALANDAQASIVHAVAAAPLSLTLTNAGTMVATATAPAADGTAQATVIGAAGAAAGASVTATVTNAGVVEALANGFTATARGLVVAGSGAAATVTLTNTGAIVATATAGDSATAKGVALEGAASLGGSNTATIAAMATGATARAAGIDLAAANGTASMLLTNGGTIAANALATGASASASARGLHVAAGTGAARLMLTNTGTLSAAATGPVATAAALSLAGTTVTATVDNTGVIAAQATGPTADAAAIAIAAAAPAQPAALRSLAVTAHAAVTPPVAATLALTNAGVLAATAKAGGSGASANAVGIDAAATGGAVTGTLGNSGTIAAQANGPVANATAVALGGSTVGATLTNTGALTASATGTTAQAYGVRVTGAATGKTGTGTVTITNAGTITARNGDGTTWTHGIAIDTTQAPNASVIDLVGQAGVADAIYGDIDIHKAGTINVQGGLTTLDGAINGDGGLRGTLDIAAGATLKLAEQPSPLTAALAGAQAAVIHVNAFNVAAGGTLFLNLPATTGVGTAFVAANTATIANGATLDLVIPTKNGLYPDSKSFTVVAAGQLSGTFTSINLLGADSGNPGSLTNASNSVLLSLTADNSCGATSVCITYTRRSFANPVGATLTYNQSHVGTALEAAYTEAATGGQQALYAHLFQDTSPAAYTGQLDQLAGAQYAVYLQSLKQLGTSFDGLLLNAGSCALATDRTACRSESRGRIWGAFNYVNAVQDSDAIATGVHANDYQIALGTDVSLGNHVALGLGGAYVWSTNRYDRYAGQIRAQGLQVGGYGAWTDGVFNARGAFSFTGIDGYGQRGIAIGTGVTALTGTEHGKLNATVWSLTGQVGARYAYGALIGEPYVRADYTRAKLDAFTEDGVPGADLNVGGGRNDRVATMVGLKWTGAFGNLAPMVDAAWRHMYGTPRAFETSAFAFAPGDAFSIASSAEARDQAVVAAGLGATVGRGISIKMSYEGAFGKQGRSNGAQLAIVVPLGR